MSSKQKSRWADDDVDTAEAVALRRREKEEKKRLKEEKLRQVAAKADAEEKRIVDDGERPSKRQKTSDGPDSPTTVEEGANLLQFPLRRFGACRDVELYELLNNIEEGSYGMVSRAKSKETGEVVALKRLKMEHNNDGFPVTGLREIQTLMTCRHANVVNLREVVMGNNSKE